MNWFLLNWVNKRPNNSSETEKPNKKNVESSNCDVHIPTCWNKSQYDGFKLSYNWLIVKNKKLGYTVCKKITRLGLFGEKNLRISKPWQKCSIKSNGQTKDFQMCSLRKIVINANLLRYVKKICFFFKIVIDL